MRSEVEARKRRRRLFTFDDMLTRLHRALTDDRLGPTACARLRARFSVSTPMIPIRISIAKIRSVCRNRCA